MALVERDLDAEVAAVDGIADALRRQGHKASVEHPGYVSAVFGGWQLAGSPLQV